ncbi:serine protease 27 [Xenopus tropicalis]|nr:serine protease 27 [Xenopus tropicalis]
MDWFHLIRALFLLNLGNYGFAQEGDGNEPTDVCGKPVVVSSRIVGGQDTKKGQNPWQVVVWHSGIKNCGGTLISSSFVLTVAHCVERVNASSVIVILGAYKITGNLKEEVSVPVKRIIKHHLYNEAKFPYDIALLELSRNVPFTDFILPACLPAPSVEFRPGHSCIVTGWGDTEYNSTKPRPDILQEVEVRLITLEDCRDLYKSALKDKYIGITDDIICAMNIHKGRDSCQGDGGGPLVCYENDRWYLIGLVSYGIGCGIGIPKLYSSVPAHMEWIRSIIPAVRSGSNRMESMPNMALVILALMYFTQ